MKIAILASEGAPYVKSGGLGDVMEALPAALARIEGNEVALFLPYYNKIKTNAAYETEKVAEFRVSLGWRQQYCAVMKLTNRADKVQVYFLDNEYYFGGRTGAIYGDMDDGERFAFFSRACLDAMVAVDFIPDVIQCNDWQCALIPTYLKAVYHAQFPKTRCMYTIHNIEYQGWANASFFDDMLGLPWEYRGTLDMNNSVNVMKGAIETADLVTTVSETYARELMYPYYAHGLDGILANNSWKLTGITNGIDTNTFNPETAKALPAHFNAKTFVDGKAKCKADLQVSLGLREEPDVPVLAIVSRLVGHKGFGMVAEALQEIMAMDVQMVVLGTGDWKFEEAFRQAQAKYPGRFAAQLTYSGPLSNQIYAGALRGAGITRAPMVIMLSSFVVFRQIYLFAMSHICNEIIPIAMSYPAGWLLSSTTMPPLLQQLRVFDFVIVDTPPLGMFPDAEILAEVAAIREELKGL